MLKLLKHAVGWPVTGPTFLLGFTLRHLQGTAFREVADDASVREELLELQLLLELGEIDEERYLEREAEFMRRLRAVREWRAHLGLPGDGGPLAFHGPGQVEAAQPLARPERVEAPEEGEGPEDAEGGERDEEPEEPTSRA